MGEEKVNEFYCPVEVTLHVMNDKWKLFIVYVLLDGAKRFKDICETFPQITQKTITQKLKELEADHIVVRNVFAEVPPRVEYSLSDMGKNLESVIKSLYDFGVGYAGKYGCSIKKK
ncbi:MAG: helix-turn-helix domain-containing protein [Campylobacterales bacterium]|nr:helix-turn-helix domain-containing protein [Campylobacterales bacterium]